MHESERHRVILSAVQDRAVVTVADLCNLTGASEATIRRGSLPRSSSNTSCNWLHGPLSAPLSAASSLARIIRRDTVI